MEDESLMLVLLRLSFLIVFEEDDVLKESISCWAVGAEWPTFGMLSVGVLWSSMIRMFGWETGVGRVASVDNWCCL